VAQREDEAGWKDVAPEVVEAKEVHSVVGEVLVDPEEEVVVGLVVS